MMGCDLFVNSKPNVGTTFTIKIKASLAQKSVPLPESKTQIPI